jgi:hypothetical protein
MNAVLFASGVTTALAVILWVVIRASKKTLRDIEDSL